jgi:hypothetical protein
LTNWHASTAMEEVRAPSWWSDHHEGGGRGRWPSGIGDRHVDGVSVSTLQRRANEFPLAPVVCECTWLA